MSLSILAAFWGVSVLFLITPGADWAYAISAGLRGKLYIPAVAGLAAGHLMATLIVAAGVGAFIATTPAAMTILTTVGALYLLWLGFLTIRQPSVPQAGKGGATDAWGRWAFRGFIISGLNPKVFLLFLALLPQFTDQCSGWPLSLQMIVLGSLEVITCVVIYLFVGYSSHAMLQTRPGAAKVVSRISGVLMVIISLLLLAEQFT